ncbi:flagellar biosynthesis protein FlhA [Salinisphaera sp. RV14]|uniref:flagellar biosynthesis protein FlhA n=1 Tax=unclassified Salinisphaera TaxID=2649847 RepID=UPI003F86159B
MADTAATPTLRRRQLPAALLVGPLAILLVIAMIVVPLPAFMLSFLFALNIAAGLLILATSLYILAPTDLTAFPSLLLVTTLARLALNVATSRVILLHGYQGPTAAGAVIESFGEFVVGGNYVVGFIIFIILIVINFVVVTKGAGRVAEVSARFVLDSLPGKQMAIDADLNAGMLDPKQAEKRRDQVRKEADFFGAMDGASKFIRGDVIAAMIILAINLIGGLAVGMLQHGLPLSAAARTYTLLTIGDGLAAQIPSLTISIAAGLVVTRVASGQDVGAQVAAQIGRFPQALAAAAGLMTILGLVPGMAHWPFLVLALALGASAWLTYRRRAAEGQTSDDSGDESADAAGAQASAETQQPLSNRDVSGVDPLGLEIGFALVPLIEHSGQRFLDRMRTVRERYGQQMGFIVPPVYIRDSDQLSPNEYRFTIRGASVGNAELMPEMWLAITGPSVSEPLTVGRETVEPAYGSQAYWIDHDDIDTAEAYGYTVVDPQSAMATHLDQVLKRYGHELLGRPQVEALMNGLADNAPRLAEEIQRHLSTGTIRQVLQDLLAERLPIRDLETICETALEAAVAGERNPATISEQARVQMGRFIVDWLSQGANTLQVAVLDPDLEELIGRGIATARDNGMPDALEPNAAHELRAAAQQALDRFQDAGLPPILAVQSVMRRPVARTASPLSVIALEEIPQDKPVQVLFRVPDRSDDE